jgi:hypothetical protein
LQIESDGDKIYVTAFDASDDSSALMQQKLPDGNGTRV